MCIICRDMETRAVIAFIPFAFALTIATYFPAASALARPQIQTGTIKGTVVDATGAALAGARIVLDNSITGFQSETFSDSQGAFVFDNLPFDSYRLRVIAGGFRAFAQAVSVRSNIPVAIEIRLTAAGVSETVLVEPGDPLVERDSTSTETDIDE